MANFWTFETDLPPGVGFSWYHAGHWAWLLGILGAGVLLGLCYRRASPGESAGRTGRWPPSCWRWRACGWACWRWAAIWT